MVKKTSRRKKAPRSRKKTAVKVEASRLPLDAYEAWLKRQTVRRVPSKPEVQAPLDSYEQWIRAQVKMRLKSK